MSLLEKIICLSDYIEPARSFEGLEEVRDLAQVNIDMALLKAIEGTIVTLIKRQQRVFPLTLHARNDLLDVVLGE
jgi:HD superfamily phosphohydrolase YqeK